MEQTLQHENKQRVLSWNYECLYQMTRSESPGGFQTGAVTSYMRHLAFSARSVSVSGLYQAN